MKAEMEHHLSMQTERHRAGGMSDEEARHAALRQFGNIASVQERARDVRLGTLARELMQAGADLRTAIRHLAKHPWFATAVVATLALGLGINTMVFSLVNAVLIRPVPVPGGERLVTMVGHRVTDRDGRFGVSYPDFIAYRDGLRSFARLEAASGNDFVLGEDDVPPERVRGMRVTAGLFDMLQMPAVLGRGFRPEDGRADAAPVALIGHALWQRRYGGSPDVLGRVVRVDGATATIVGVMPPEFAFPKKEELWVPLVPDAILARREHRPLRLFGMLQPGKPIGEAQEEVAAIASRLAAEFPESNRDLSPLVLTFHEAYSGGPVRTVFLLLLGAGGCVLLIACANVANMLLIRTLARRRELSIRAALGASRWQIVRQVLVESLLLSALGAAAGLGLAQLGVEAFAELARGSPVPYWVSFRVDGVVFAYCAALAVVSGVALGLVPALRASRNDIEPSLRDGSPALSPGRGWLTDVFVVLQFSLAVVLLAAAGMMLRSFFATAAMNDFIPVERLLVARVDLPSGAGERYATAEARRRFFSDLVEQLGALPGVSRLAATSNLPGTGSGAPAVEIAGRPVVERTKAPRAYAVTATPGYLSALNLPLLAGRDFTTVDGRSGTEAVVVTQAFAAQFWPGESALGRQLRFIDGERPGPWMRVVGVCADMVQNPTELGAPGLVFVPHRQNPQGGMLIVMRTAADPSTLAAPLRAVVQRLDPNLPLSSVDGLPAVYAREFWHLRAFGLLFFTFALAALVMASVGIYAVIAHNTVRRTQEIGVRIALGAGAGRIAALVLSRGLKQLGLGVLIGLGGALAITRLMSSADILFRVSASDPVVFASIVGVLALLGLTACWLPARRAMRVDPVVALRSE